MINSVGRELMIEYASCRKPGPGQSLPVCIGFTSTQLFGIGGKKFPIFEDSSDGPWNEDCIISI